jgi:hypothetical protein
VTLTSISLGTLRLSSAEISRNHKTTQVICPQNEKENATMFASTLQTILPTLLAGTMLTAGPVPLKNRLQKSYGHQYVTAKQQAQAGKRKQAIRKLTHLANKMKGTKASHTVQDRLRTY